MEKKKIQPSSCKPFIVESNNWYNFLWFFYLVFISGIRISISGSTYILVQKSPNFSIAAHKFDALKGILLEKFILEKKFRTFLIISSECIFITKITITFLGL